MEAVLTRKPAKRSPNSSNRFMIKLARPAVPKPVQKPLASKVVSVGASRQFQRHTQDKWNRKEIKKGT